MEVEDDDDIAKYVVDSEEDEDAEAMGVSASVGGPSTSWTAPEEARCGAGRSRGPPSAR